MISQEDSKTLKDPVYGYISIPTIFMNRIVDTAQFQRLRRIIQTSYSPLYSSAMHNRFVHSLGVYHLGEIVCEQFIEEVKKQIQFELFESMEEKLICLGRIFKLACLLHDVGHSPFSHTGEEFFLDGQKGYGLIHEKLVRLIQCSKFERDIPSSSSKSAAPHEIVSAIIGIENYGDFFPSVEEKAFFARCITGYFYQEPTKEESIKNCFISLLNSKVIDVDKLDYLIRDAYLTGFDTVNIDFVRLLGAVTVYENESGENSTALYEVAYLKKAVSVIENVIYAHDAERKWIQTHPIVLYESYILENIIYDLEQKISREEKTLFSLESLSYEGQTFDECLSIRLLCDDDIIFLMKNVYESELSEEFLSRNKRRHPIWKSEAEYRAYMLSKIQDGQILDDFKKAMQSISHYLTKSSELWAINAQAVQAIEDDLEKINSISEDFFGGTTKETKKAQEKEKNNMLKIMKSLEKYAKQHSIEFDFVILSASQFYSGFGKPDFSKTKVIFQSQDGRRAFAIKEIISPLAVTSKPDDSFFYLFYQRKETKPQETESDNLMLDPGEIFSMWLREFV